jgi:hypothetical protein
MNAISLPTTRQLTDCFTEEITGAGGRLHDAYDDGRRLFLRATVPATWDVRPRDKVQGGVALRTTDREVLVHPYVFRQVCKNGAIVAQAIQTRRVDRVEDTPFADPEEAAREVLAEVAAAVRECCAEEIFTDYTDRLRSACEIEADMILQVVPYLARLPQGVAAQVLADVDARFRKDRDRSLFGLMNAVTATARDTHDPELRWRLEELGGGIPALVEPRDLPGGAALALRS